MITNTPRTTLNGSDRVERLRGAARDAAEIRSLANRPDVLALQVERVGRQVDALLWSGIGLGLLFTMVNVQRFAAGDAAAFSPVGWAAWLLDPMVSLILLAVVRAEQPEEIAAAAVFLASAASSFVNGSELAADGGSAQI